MSKKPVKARLTDLNEDTDLDAMAGSLYAALMADAKAHEESKKKAAAEAAEGGEAPGEEQPADKEEAEDDSAS